MFEPSEFFQFLKKPQYQHTEAKETSIIPTAIKIYLLVLIFIGLINSLNTTILRAFFVLPVDMSLEVPAKWEEHLWLYFLLVAIIAPFIEEVIFRLSLIFKPYNISLSVSTLVSLIINRLSYHLISIISFFLVFVLIYELTSTYKEKMISFWDKNFKYIFYFLSLLFGLVHMSNYRCTVSSQYLLASVLIFPQVAMGFILSFTRVYYKKGFIIGIIIHCIFNTVGAGIILHGYLNK
jgi:membrane protease YdiL (CAAX protease family)